MIFLIYIIKNRSMGIDTWSISVEKHNCYAIIKISQSVMQASIKSTLKKYSSIYFRPLVSDEISSVDADFNSSSEALPTGWCMVLYHSLSPWFTKLLIVHRRLSPFLKNYKSFHHSIPKYSTEIQGSWNLLCSSNRLIGTRALYHLFYHFIIKSLKEKTTKRVRTYSPLGQGRFTDTPD